MIDPFREDELKYDVELPFREFMFTLDQIAFLLDIDEQYMIRKYLYLPGRSTGIQAGRMRATNIARADQPPNWRVSETDLKFWMKSKGIRWRQPLPARGRKLKGK